MSAPSGKTISDRIDNPTSGSRLEQHSQLSRLSFFFTDFKYFVWFQIAI